MLWCKLKRRFRNFTFRKWPLIPTAPDIMGSTEKSWLDARVDFLYSNVMYCLYILAQTYYNRYDAQAWHVLIYNVLYYIVSMPALEEFLHWENAAIFRSFYL